MIPELPEMGPILLWRGRKRLCRGVGLIAGLVGMRALGENGRENMPFLTRALAGAVNHLRNPSYRCQRQWTLLRGLQYREMALDLESVVLLHQSLDK